MWNFCFSQKVKEEEKQKEKSSRSKYSKKTCPYFPECIWKACTGWISRENQKSGGWVKSHER